MRSVRSPACAGPRERHEHARPWWARPPRETPASSSTPLVAPLCDASSSRRHLNVVSRLPSRDGDHMFLSDLSCRMSADSSTTVLSPLFFHQCEVVWISRAPSPALCTIGTEQVLAYSTISPSMM